MVITDTKAFGQAIRNRRKQLHYTQAYLSEFCGFSISFISDLERGKETIEFGKALYLANLLGLNIEVNTRESEGTDIHEKTSRIY